MAYIMKIDHSYIYRDISEYRDAIIKNQDLGFKEFSKKKEKWLNQITKEQESLKTDLENINQQLSQLNRDRISLIDRFHLLEEAILYLQDKDVTDTIASSRK